MNISRKWVLLFLAVVAGAIFALLQTFNLLAGRNRDQIHQELQRVLGKEVYFEKLEASIFSGLGFSAREFSVADNPRFAATPFVRARELVLGVSVWNLFRGRVVINSLSFVDPEVQIITDEKGVMNVSELTRARKEPVPPFRPRTGQKRERWGVNLAIASVRLRNGRIEYIDRSVKEPAELRIRNVVLDIAGLDSKGNMTVKLAAAVTESLVRDVRIEGQWGTADANLDWMRQPINFDFQFDSLHLPVIARAVAYLRDKIPRELDVTGPLSLRAKLIGTLEKPRISAITLKVPLFGSEDYNAVLEGAVAFSKSRTWEDAEIEGRLAVKPINFSQLRALSLLKNNLPTSFETDGNISILSRFEGTWRNLRIGALINADSCELRYRDWMKKPAGIRARLRAGISRGKYGFVLHESDLILGGSKMTVSGSTLEAPPTRWQLKLRAQKSPVAVWSRLLSPLPIAGARGAADWDIVISRDFAVNGGALDLRGELKIADAEFKHKASGRNIEKLNAAVSFLGDQAQVQNAEFRIGSSTIALAVTAALSFEPRASYRLRSAILDFSDLPESGFGESARLKDVAASGEVRLQNGVPVINGLVTSPDGILQSTVYKNLRAELVWSPAGISAKNLSLHAFSGTLRASGYWAHRAEEPRQFAWSSQVESMNLRDLLAQTLPQLKDRIDGQFSLRGQLDATARQNLTIRESLNGSGEAVVRRGTLRDFNLFNAIFRRGGGATAPTRLSPRLAEVLAELLARRDTPFDTLKANFTVAQQRIRSANMLLSTPDYDIQFAGWIAFDRTARWNGLLVLSPRLSQEFLRDNRMIRYLMDRRERLTIPFRIEGTLPDLKARPDTRAIAQAIRRGSPPRAPEPPPVREPRPEPSERREPLPEAFDQLLHR
jgi:hypothetical protein